MSTAMFDSLDSLSLTDAERQIKVISDSDLSNPDNCLSLTLVGRVFTERRIDFKNLKDALDSLWRCRRPFDVREIGDNVISFRFGSEFDKRRILLGEPWVFNRQVLILGESDSRTTVQPKDLIWTPFWVQIYNLPFLSMNSDVGTLYWAFSGSVYRAKHSISSNVCAIPTSSRLVSPASTSSASLAATTVQHSNAGVTDTKGKVKILQEAVSPTLPTFPIPSETAFSGNLSLIHGSSSAVTCSPNKKSGSKHNISKACLSTSNLGPPKKDPSVVVSSNVSTGPSLYVCSGRRAKEAKQNKETICYKRQFQDISGETRKVVKRTKITEVLDGSSTKVAGAAGQIDIFRSKLKFYGGIEVARRGLADVTSSSFRFTGFYGAPEAHNRVYSWTLICQLRGVTDGPWLIMGDMNEVMTLEDKKGGAYRSDAAMDAFRNCFDNCELRPMDFNGPQTRIQERLDWVFINSDWDSLFPLSDLHHLGFHKSDHRVLRVRLSSPTAFADNRGIPHFRFESLWLEDEDCEDIISNIWHSPASGSALEDLLCKFSTCADSLSSWHHRKFGKRKQTIKEKSNLLRILYQQLEDPDMDAISKLGKELDDVLLQDETYWQQRSRVQWMKAGDNNTKFFQSRANYRRKLNRIKGYLILREFGKPGPMKLLILFSYSTPNCSRPNSLLRS
ncbi:Endonuclease/exonuclease/phosphatase [Trema orientale]|uniref:Endonuclease/exonuclease/phosphatase n=1 Tax=Trema orientale TaxID=63057 RepID=A0A2P5FD54_TREOI|nr:Endonuclease/exonuclease/phosphatase [Trema orientale]